MPKKKNRAAAVRMSFVLKALAAALCLAKGASCRIDLSGFTGGARWT
ncbi:MAG TPA: hypothetical protein VD995_24835 [Azospirillum sp.]|nr:hypothetical protein [Azospirillum sp.]